MRQLRCHGFGPPPDLRLEDAPEPRAGDGELLVAVDAANVAFVDRLVVRGLYQVRPDVPFTPGTVLTGTVLEVGAGVDDVAIGTRIAGMMTGYGAFSTRAVIPARSTAPLPPGMSVTEAVAAIEPYGTAHFALTRRGGLRRGESVLVLGAGGAVGRAAVDTARLLGAEVVGVTSGRDRQEDLMTLDAIEVIDRRDVELRAHLREGYPDGFDVVLDPVGGPMAEQALRSLRELGRYLVVGFASGSIPQLPANHVLLRNRTVHGVDWGGWMARTGRGLEGALEEVLQRLAAGQLRPPPVEVVGLDDLAGLLAGDAEVSRCVLVP